MEMHPQNFRKGLGCFATGVTIVTTVDPRGRPIGITANSFNAVSLDPPLVLFSLGHHAHSLKALLSTHHFAVNVLRDTQAALSDRFSRPAEDKWSGLDYEIWDTDCPIFPEALANFECKIRYTHMGGDHVIFVGEVIRMNCDLRGHPLLFYQGRYRELAEPEAQT